MDLSEWDFTGVDLNGWNLENCNLENAIFNRYDEEEAEEIIVYLQGANFTGASLQGAHLDYFSDCQLIA